MAKTNLTADHLRAILHYDPASGLFRWIVRAKSTRPPGSMAGSSSGRYVIIGIDGNRYWAHRLAFLYMTGDWPKHCVDHINRDGLDNRWSNLRDVPMGINNRNKDVPNSTGFVGLKKRRGFKWQATITIGGKSTSLGSFRSTEEGQEAYMTALRLLESSEDEALAFAKTSRDACRKSTQATRLRVLVGDKPLPVADAAKALGVSLRTAYNRATRS